MLDSTFPRESASPGGRWIRGIGALLTFALACAGLTCQGTRAKGNTRSAQEPVTLHLDTFVLNLVDPDQHAYLRVGIDLSLNPRDGKDATGPQSIALIRDTILGVLTGAHPEEILTADGKTKLKAELLQALRNRAPELGAQEIYFNEFLVQR